MGKSHYNTPQHAATYCDTLLQHTGVMYTHAPWNLARPRVWGLQHTATHYNKLDCNTLQHILQHTTATHDCNTLESRTHMRLGIEPVLMYGEEPLQHTATHCNTLLQHTTVTYTPAPWNWAHAHVWGRATECSCGELPALHSSWPSSCEFPTRVYAPWIVHIQRFYSYMTKIYIHDQIHLHVYTCIMSM